ncbi:uncharacterized protein [Physcomitrium patens]|uniref:Uncharacterized protein n=1 Tax=Physcomitrium patens TaxID=3218 RepID=A0A7I4C6R0_PHYPA
MLITAPHSSQFLCVQKSFEKRLAVRCLMSSLSLIGTASTKWSECVFLFAGVETAKFLMILRGSILRNLSAAFSKAKGAPASSTIFLFLFDPRAMIVAATSIFTNFLTHGTLRININ